MNLGDSLLSFGQDNCKNRRLDWNKRAEKKLTGTKIGPQLKDFFFVGLPKEDIFSDHLLSTGTYIFTDYNFLWASEGSLCTASTPLSFEMLWALLLAVLLYTN